MHVMPGMLGPVCPVGAGRCGRYRVLFCKSVAPVRTGVPWFAPLGGDGSGRHLVDFGEKECATSVLTTVQTALWEHQVAPSLLPRTKPYPKML